MRLSGGIVGHESDAGRLPFDFRLTAARSGRGDGGYGPGPHHDRWDVARGGPLASAFSQRRRLVLFLCPICGRRARVLKLYEKIACWRCTSSGSPPRRLFYRVEQGDKAQRIERLRQRLCGGPARVKPRPGRTIDRRWRTEQALKRALIAERSRVKGAKDALAKERPDDSGELR